MSVAVVSLSAALICFGGQCHNALVGKETPKGTFPLVQRQVLSPGYGGDVLQFTESKAMWLAVHRVWLLKPAERRREKLASPRAADRRDLTAGCINVDEEVYAALQRATASAAITSITITD